MLTFDLLKSPDDCLLPDILLGGLNDKGCGLFAYSWKLPAYSGAFLHTIDHFSFFAYNLSFFACKFSYFAYNWSFFAYSGIVRLIRALRNRKPRSLTVSKKAPTVSKKASPMISISVPRFVVPSRRQVRRV